MLMVDMLTWWYSRGWGVFVSGLKTRLRDSADFFSIGQLLRTLFKPYRQISAGTSGGGMSGFLDRLVSRIVGFFVRFFIIIFGAIALFVEVLVGVIMIVLWPTAPVLIIAGVVMTVIGVKLWCLIMAGFARERRGWVKNWAPSQWCCYL